MSVELLCPDCGEMLCECPPCDPQNPCKPEQWSDDDACCAHGGLCQDSAHDHYDRYEHSEWLIDGYLEGEANRRRPMGER